MYRVEVGSSSIISIHEDTFVSSSPAARLVDSEGRSYLVVGDNVPVIQLVNDDTWYHLLDVELHEWIESRGYFYTLDLETKWNKLAGYPSYKWFVAFSDNSAAILFKLTWGGS